MKIRDFTERDVPGMATAKLAAWRRFYRGIVPDAMLDSMTVDQVQSIMLSELTPAAKALVLESDQAVAGYVMYGASRPPSAIDNSVAEVMQIYLQPSVVRMGLGRLLIQEALDRLFRDGFRAVTVWCFEKNAGGCRFFEAVGFTQDAASRVVTLGGTQINLVCYEKELAIT